MPPFQIGAVVEPGINPDSGRPFWGPGFGAVTHVWQAHGVWWVQFGQGAGATVMPARKLRLYQTPRF